MNTESTVIEVGHSDGMVGRYQVEVTKGLGTMSATRYATRERAVQMAESMANLLDLLGQPFQLIEDGEVLREGFGGVVGRITLRLTPAELRLMWLGTETLREANPDDPHAAALDLKVSELIELNGLNETEDAR